MTDRLTDDIADILPDRLRIVAADEVRVGPAEVPYPLAVALHPDREGRDLVLVGVLRVDARRDQIVHHVEDHAAGVQEKGFSVRVDEVDDGPVGRDDEPADVPGRDECVALESEVVAEAEDAVDVPELRHEALPDREIDRTHGGEKFGVQLRIVGGDVAELGVAGDVLHALEDAVARPSDGFHARGHDLAEGPEVLRIGGEEEIGYLRPGIGLEARAVHDDTRHVPAESARARHDGADTLLETHRVVAHRREEAAVLSEVFLLVREVPARESGEARAEDGLHDFGADYVLVERKPLRLHIARGIFDTGIIGLEIHGILSLRGMFQSMSKRQEPLSTKGIFVFSTWTEPEGDWSRDSRRFQAIETMRRWSICMVLIFGMKGTL